MKLETLKERKSSFIQFCNQLIQDNSTKSTPAAISCVHRPRTGPRLTRKKEPQELARHFLRRRITSSDIEGQVVPVMCGANGLNILPCTGKYTVFSGFHLSLTCWQSTYYLNSPEDWFNRLFDPLVNLSQSYFVSGCFGSLRVISGSCRNMHPIFSHELSRTWV